MLYAMSDIHGCLDAFEERLKEVDLSGDNKLLLLGDYIDYGPASGQVLERIYQLQKIYGDDKVIALKGNHEDMLLTWIDSYEKGAASVPEEMTFDNWLRADSMQAFNTYRTLVSEDAFGQFTKIARTASFGQMNREAVRLLLSEKNELIAWLRKLPLFYETPDHIFVHAGIDEDAEDLWPWGTAEHIFLWKYPATTGSFYKTIIAGHVGTCELAHDKGFHDIYFDGESHYYIDGTVYDGGQLNLLQYDETSGKYVGGMKKLS